ncbi:hypothetical protein BH24CHL6_BH24CHL6_08780 [soil metagenome]
MAKTPEAQLDAAEREVAAAVERRRAAEQALRDERYRREIEAGGPTRKYAERVKAVDSALYAAVDDAWRAFVAAAESGTWPEIRDAYKPYAEARLAINAAALAGYSARNWLAPYGAFVPTLRLPFASEGRGWQGFAESLALAMEEVMPRGDYAAAIARHEEELTAAGASWNDPRPEYQEPAPSTEGLAGARQLANEPSAVENAERARQEGRL